MAKQIDPLELYWQDQFARIRKRQDEIDKRFDQILKLPIENRIFPVSVILQAFIAAALILGAGAGIAKVFFQ